MHTRLIAAFAAVYLIWGSTYLAVHFALQSFPPFLLMAVRFIVAGAILYVWGRSRTEHGPTRQHWIAALFSSLLLIVGGMGTFAWAQQFVASGTAALIAALTPCFMVILQGLLIRETRTTLVTWAGVGLGFLGMVVLIGPGQSAGVPVHRGATLVLLLGCLCWALGSLYGRRAPEPDETRLATGMQLLCGGAVLAVIALASGELRAIDWADISMVSTVALLYLTVFGSLIAYTAYIWLLKNSTPARVSTHAYINPIVAVFLGWLVASEVVTLRVVSAGLLALGGVVLIILADYLSSRPPLSIPGPSPGASGLKRTRALGGPGRAAAWKTFLPKSHR
jgi:drug/metabolite transporter (DMT)-like permease